MSTTNGYPSGSESTAVATPASSTMAAEITSLAAFDNSEIDIVDVSYASGKQKFLQTLLALGRLRGEGELANTGITEVTSNNHPLIVWREQDEEAKVYTLNAALTNVATTMTLVTTVGLIPGMILRVNETNENVRVQSVDSATVITIIRGQGSIAGTAALTAGKLSLLGMAGSAGFANPDAVGSVANEKQNYIQKFVDGVDITDFDQLSNKAGGNKKAILMNAMAKARAEHMQKIELQFLYGQKSTGTDPQGRTYYQTQGLFDHARQGWTSDISGSLTRRTLDEALSTPMNYGSGTKILLCGTRVRPAISDLFYSSQVRTETLTGGAINLTVDKVTVNGGEYIIVQHPYMDTNRGMEKYAVVVDLENTKIVYPSGFDMNGKAYTGKTRFEFLASESNYARQRGDYVTYAGSKFSNPNSFAFIKVVA